MPLSYSALKTYLTCPAQYEAKYVSRTWPREADTPALRRGREVHAVLESAVRNGFKVPHERMKIWTPPGLLETLHRGGAIAEAGFAITADGQAVAPKDPAAWFVGYIDVLTAGAGAALLLDWKTGKVRVDPLQADVYAMLLRAIRPGLPVEFHWVFLEHEVVESVQVDADAERRVRSIAAQATTEQEYSPRPSFACKWCPLSKCRYYKGA